MNILNHCVTVSIYIASGGRQADVEALAKLLAIERDSYLNLVAGLPVTDLACVPCKKMKVRKDTTAIRPEQYQQYAHHMIFNSGNFTINEETISNHKDSF